MYGYNMVTLGFFGENWNLKVPLSSAQLPSILQILRNNTQLPSF